MKSKKANAVVWIFIMVVIAILFMGYYVMLKPFKMIENTLVNNTLTGLTEAQCTAQRGEWWGADCHKISQRAEEIAASAKTKWLVAPFVFVVGLILWGIHASTRDDARTFQR